LSRLAAVLTPFVDGNKRTSRLIANAVLLAHGYPPLSYRSVDEQTYKGELIIFYERGALANFRDLFVEHARCAVLSWMWHTSHRDDRRPSCPSHRRYWNNCWCRTCRWINSSRREGEGRSRATEAMERRAAQGLRGTIAVYFGSNLAEPRVGSNYNRYVCR
jgi:hypothetical protein